MSTDFSCHLIGIVILYDIYCLMLLGNGISQILRSPRSPDEWDVTLISRLANFAPAVGLRPRRSECDSQDDSGFHFLPLASARKQLACDCLYFNAFEAGPAQTYGGSRECAWSRLHPRGIRGRGGTSRRSKSRAKCPSQRKGNLGQACLCGGWRGRNAFRRDLACLDAVNSIVK
jgi:hypothetical protein